MRVPDEVQAKIVELGQNVLSDDVPDADIGEEGALWLFNHEKQFTLDVLGEWWRKRTRQWVYSQTRDTLGGDSDEPGTVPFPELHPYLEIAPGVMKHQNMMTAKDWDNVLAIYQNRRDQAAVAYRQVKRRYDEIRPLLHDDLTTADALAKLAEPKPIRRRRQAS